MSEYDELVKRLRDGFITMECDDDVVRYTNHVAADAIEALVGEVERLNGALKPFAKLETYRGAHDPAEGSMRMRVLLVSEIEDARSALEAKP